MRGGENMLSAITNFVSIKVLAIVLTLLVLLGIGFGGYSLVKYLAPTNSWCTFNHDACRDAMILDMERHYKVLNPSK